MGGSCIKAGIYREEVSQFASSLIKGGLKVKEKKGSGAMDDVGGGRLERGDDLDPVGEVELLP